MSKKIKKYSLKWKKIGDIHNLYVVRTHGGQLLEVGGVLECGKKRFEPLSAGSGAPAHSSLQTAKRDEKLHILKYLPSLQANQVLSIKSSVHKLEMLTAAQELLED